MAIESDAPRALALVVNHRAGALLDGASDVDGPRAHLATAGLTVREVQSPGRLPDRIRLAMEQGSEGILIAGGDGSVACAAQLLAGSDRVLGILPAGTMNLLARDLGLPVDDLAAAADVLAGGRVRRIDVGVVSGHVFTCACMLGAPARIGHHRELARRHGHGPLSWLRVVRAALRVVRRTRATPLTLRIDGRDTRVNTHALTISVNALDDASGRAFGRTVLDGGRLCAYVLHRHTAWDLARLAWHFATGTTRDRALRRLDGRDIEVLSDAGMMRVLIDGEEHLLQSPLRFTLRPRALAVLAPAS